MAIIAISAAPSRNIALVEYDEDAQELYVTYNWQNARYLFRDIPPDTAHGFEHAPSANLYLKSFIETISVGERIG